MSSQVVTVPRKKTAAPQVSFLSSSVVTASKRLRVETKAEAQTDVMTLVNEFRQEITSTETVVQTLTQVLHDQQVQHKTLTEESESQARQNAALKACIDRYATKYQQIDRSLDNFLLLLSEAKIQHNSTLVRAQAAQQVADGMFARKLKLSEKAHAFRSEVDTFALGQFLAFTSSTTQETLRQREQCRMMEEDCRSYAHRIQIIDVATIKLTRQLQLVTNEETPLLAQEWRVVQQHLVQLQAATASPLACVAMLRENLSATAAAAGMAIAELGSLEWEAKQLRERRRHTILELDVAIKEHKADVDELYDKAARCREKAVSAEEHKLSNRDEKMAVAKSVASLDLKLEQLNIAWEDQFAELHQRTTVQLAALQRKRDEDEAAYQAHVDAVIKKQERIVQLDRAVYVIQRQIDEQKALFEQTRQRLQEQVAAELEQVNALQSRCARSGSRFDQLTLERAETINKLDAAQNQLQRHNQLCKEQESRVATLNDDLATVHEELEQARQKFNEAKDRTNSTFVVVLQKNEENNAVLFRLKEESDILQRQCEDMQSKLAHDAGSQTSNGDAQEIDRVALELLENTDYMREEQALRAQLEQIQHTCKERLDAYRQAQERELDRLRQQCEQRRSEHAASQRNERDDGNADNHADSQRVCDDECTSDQGVQGNAKARSGDTDARTPASQWAMKHATAASKLTVKKTQRSAKQAQKVAKPSNQLYSCAPRKSKEKQRRTNSRQPLNSPVPACSKLNSSQQQHAHRRPVTAGGLQMQSQTKPVASKQPLPPRKMPPSAATAPINQRRRIPSSSQDASKKSIDWFDDEAFTF